MQDLINALQIFLKYGNPEFPTCCEHDVLYVCIDPGLVSEEDLAELERLGFDPSEVEGFESYRFGAA